MPDNDALNEADEPLISIGILARKVGLSVSAVRKYENEGLIIVHRAASGHRLFSHDDIHRLQHLIQDLGLNIAGIHRMQSLLPCWELLPCAEETRRHCPAYLDNTRPCWMIKGLNCAPQGNECRRCIVYRFGSLCTEDIKRLLHDQNDLQNADAAIKELVHRKRVAKQKEC